MEQKTSIWNIFKSLDGLCFSFSLYLEEFDSVSSEVNAALRCVLDKGFQELVLGAFRIYVINHEV